MQVIKNITSNAFLHDVTLSFKAKGLMCILLTLNDNENVDATVLSALCADGARSIRSAANELENAGYLTKSRGNRNRLVYELHERKV